jgi:hypothetical protein
VFELEGSRVAAKPEYQREPTVLSEEIWAAGEIKPLQLLRIGAWKSAKGVASLTLNTEEEISIRSNRLLTTLEPMRRVDVLNHEPDWDQWTDVARTAIGSAKAGTGLLGLHGVGYPMATAVLAILSPAVWPVMDKWTVLAVFGDEVGLRWQRAIAYRAFTERLRELAPNHYSDSETIHAVDQRVMNSIIGCTEARDACTHVSFPVIKLPN